jgi:hypothetical protein
MYFSFLFFYVGIFDDLIQMRIEAGDQYLQNHIEKVNRNAIYISPQIQNEIININGKVIRDYIMNDVKKTVAVSIMADEIADILGTEQLSIGIRFFDDEKRAIRICEYTMIDFDLSIKFTGVILEIA